MLLPTGQTVLSGVCYYPPGAGSQAHSLLSVWPWELNFARPQFICKMRIALAPMSLVFEKIKWA